MLRAARLLSKVRARGSRALSTLAIEVKDVMGKPQIQAAKSLQLKERTANKDKNKQHENKSRHGFFLMSAVAVSTADEKKEKEQASVLTAVAELKAKIITLFEKHKISEAEILNALSYDPVRKCYYTPNTRDNDKFSLDLRFRLVDFFRAAEPYFDDYKIRSVSHPELSEAISGSIESCLRNLRNRPVPPGKMDSNNILRPGNQDAIFTYIGTLRLISAYIESLEKFANNVRTGQSYTSCRLVLLKEQASLFETVKKSVDGIFKPAEQIENEHQKEIDEIVASCSTSLSSRPRV